MRYNLLEAVQHILSSMDSDEVASINDTTESSQVVKLLKGVFYDCATDLGLIEHETLFELNASGSSSLPTYMTVPENVTKVLGIKYNNKATGDTHSDYVQVNYVPWDEFIEQQRGYVGGATADVGEMSFTMNSETFEVMYRKDQMPRTYSTIKNQVVIFDSIDLDEDTTLQKSKTMCTGLAYPTFPSTDTGAITLDPTQFSYFLNKAKSRAFTELKQTENREAAGEARRQKIITQKRRERTGELTPLEKAQRYGR